MARQYGRTALIALALYSAVLAVLFQEPIRRGIGISPYDLTYRFSNFAYLEPGLHPSNDTLVDQPLQFEIRHEYARREIRAGRIPWTNPYQGGGTDLRNVHGYSRRVRARLHSWNEKPLVPGYIQRLFTAGLVIAGALALGYFVFQSAAGRGPGSLFPSHEGLKQVSFLMLRLGVLSAAASLFWRWRIGAAAMVAIVALLVGSEAMSYAMNYNPAFDLHRRYPVTPGIRFLQSHAGANWTLFRCRTAR
jgi:hypothetical protein